MNVITRNVRGLGRPAKCFLVKDFLNLHFADVYCLQESKLESISAAMWREIGGPHLDKFVFLPSIGASGGMIIGWNSVLLTGSLVFEGKFCMSMDFCSKRDNFTWSSTSVYGPNARQLKEAF